METFSDTLPHDGSRALVRVAARICVVSDGTGASAMEVDGDAAEEDLPQQCLQFGLPVTTSTSV